MNDFRRRVEEGREKRDLTTRPNEGQIVAQAQEAAGLQLSPEWSMLLQAVVQGILAALLRKYGG